MKIAVTVIGIMVMCICTGSISKDNQPAPELKHHKQCRFPKGKHGEVHTDGCIRSTCMYGKWKPKMRTDICCYKQKVFKPMSMLDTIVSADNCSTIISCGAHAEMQIDKNCGVPATKQQVETLETKMEQQISDVKETIANVSVNVTCGKKSDDIYETVKKVDKGIEDMEKNIEKKVMGIENITQNMKSTNMQQSKDISDNVRDVAKKIDNNEIHFENQMKNQTEILVSKMRQNAADQIGDISKKVSGVLKNQTEVLAKKIKNVNDKTDDIADKVLGEFKNQTEEINTNIKSLENAISDQIKTLENDIEDKVKDLKNTSNWQSKKVNHQIEDLTIKFENVTQTSGKHAEEINKNIDELKNTSNWQVEELTTKFETSDKHAGEMSGKLNQKVDELKNTSNWQIEKVNHQIEELTIQMENVTQTNGKHAEKINKNINDLKNTSNGQIEKVNHQIEELTIQMENATQHSVEMYSNIETLETDVKNLAQTIQDHINDQAQMTQQIMRTLASLTQMMVKHTMVQGVIITGGHGALTSTELFLPESGKTCSLQSLPDNREYHTMDNLAGHIILCGGWDTNTRTSCLEFLPTSSTGSWAHYSTLAQGRYDHTTYISKDSEQLMLMGGAVSPGTTEILGEGGQYSLQQDTNAACSIPEQSSTILTGGYDGSGILSSVVRYDYQGYVEDLPDLATARRNHGCGYYEDNGDKVLVVAGGWGSAGARFSTTELLTPGAKAWSTGESLPRTLSYTSSVNMDGFILLIGGWDGNRRVEVLKFAGTWTEVGRMKNARNHAAATIIEIPREGGILDISDCI